jgi:predicted acetyltransferase
MELWTGAFGDAGWIFDSLNEGTTDRRLEHTLVAEVDGRLVSGVDVFIRPMRDEAGLPVQVGGIGSVATHEDFRRQGHSGKLLLAAIELMVAEECAWSLLFTGTFSHYARYGWEETPWRRTVGGKRSGTVGGGKFEISALGNVGPWPLEDLARVYSAFNALRPMSHVRTPLYWEIPIRVRLERPERRTCVARRAGEVVGYVVSSVGDEGLELIEAGYLTGAEDCVTGLFAAALEGSIGRVALSLPRDEVFDAAVERFVSEAREEPARGPMSRGIGPGWTVDRIRTLTGLPGAHCWELDGF